MKQDTTEFQYYFRETNQKKERRENPLNYKWFSQVFFFLLFFIRAVHELMQKLFFETETGCTVKKKKQG